MTARRSAPKRGAASKRSSRNVRILNAAHTPLANADGSLRLRVQPYLPVFDACANCPARCCRLNVKVSLPDAVRYTSVLDVPLFAGITLVASDHPTRSFEVERDPRFVAPDERWAGRAELRLRRTDDGACLGLVRIGGFERCGVYDARPSLCRLYPVMWEADDASGGPEVVMCPVPYGIDPASERKFIDAIERSIEESRIHDTVVAEWNGRDASVPRTVEGFVEFALPKAAEKIGLSAAVALGLPTREARLYEAMVRSKILRPPSRPSDGST